MTRIAQPVVIATAGVLLGGLLIGFGAQSGPGDIQLQAAGLGIAGLTLFATRAVPDIVTALAVFLTALAIGANAETTVFLGFTSSGFWLLFSGIILGAAVSATGLASRFSAYLSGWSGNTYGQSVATLSLAGLALGVLIPSTMPRIIVMMPIALALAERQGYSPKSREAMGLAAAAAASTLLPTYAILTANLPTIVQVGAMERLYGLSSSYSEYLLAQLPVNALRFLLIVGLLRRISSATTAPTTSPVTLSKPDKAERLLLTVLLVAIILWFTDFMHGISPAWIAMAAAGIVIWPRLGMLGSMAMRERIDLSPAIFFAALVTLSAVARDAGLDIQLADYLITHVPFSPDGGLASVYAVFFFAVIISHLTTAPAAPAILVPFALPLAEVTGLSMEVVSMIQIIGIATPLLPYQAPPLIVAMSLSNIPSALLTRLCLFMALAVTAIGVPLTYLWWQLMGII
ncbi:MAG: SLC13 family permease [Stappiaceae bacterium]